MAQYDDMGNLIPGSDAWDNEDGSEIIDPIFNAPTRRVSTRRVTSKEIARQIGWDNTDIPDEYIPVSAPLRHFGFNLFEDPTERIEPPTPGTRGIVLSVAALITTVLWQGREIETICLGKAAVVDDVVSVIIIDTSAWCIKDEGGYPSAWSKDLWLWCGNYPASLFIAYCMKDNPRRYRYLPCEVLEIPDQNMAIVRIFTGEELYVPIMYGEEYSSSDLGAGMLYYPDDDNPILIGQGEIGACAIGSITATDFSITPTRVYSQQLTPISFAPITWERVDDLSMVQLTIDNNGLLEFAGLNKARDFWLTGMFITPTVGCSGQIQYTDDLIDPVFTVISVTPILSHASVPVDVTLDGVLSMKF